MLIFLLKMDSLMREFHFAAMRAALPIPLCRTDGMGEMDVNKTAWSTSIQ